MISFRPISFHCSSTACEGLGAGFGGSFFAASCATTGSTAHPIAKANPATHLSFFIFPSLRLRPNAGRTFFQTHHSARRFPRPASTSHYLHSVPGLPRGFILRSKALPVMRNSQPPHGKLVFCIGGADLVNWGFLLLRIAIGLSILTLLYLSQRFWYRALWRVTSHWGRVPLRVGPRVVYIVLLLLIIVTIAQGLVFGRAAFTRRSSMVSVFAGLWFFSALFAYIAVKNQDRKSTRLNSSHSQISYA